MTSNQYTQSVITFDGQNDYIDFGKNDIGGVFAEGSSAFTISGWVNPLHLTNQATTYRVHNVFFARSSDRYSDNFEFGISEEGNLDVYIDEKIDNVIKTFGNGELTVGQWHFFAIVFNQGQLSVYLDDHEYTGSLTGSTLNRATSPVTLGATLHNNVYFTGQLANISIWNYPCTQVEIQTHRSGSLVGNEAGLVAYWKLNEGEGISAGDQTGNGHNGKLRGNPSWNFTQIPFAIAQSFNESEITSSSEEVIESVAEVVFVEVTTNEQAELQQESVQNDAPTQLTTTPKQKKQTRKQSEKSTDIQTPQIIQPEEEETKTDQTSQSEVLVDLQQPQTITQERSPTTMNTTPNTKYKILAIDGGGIRGIIPALILAEIEKRTQKQIFSLFDLITGTSSGGILALGLTKPRLNPTPSDSAPTAEYSAEDLVQLFAEYGAEIFYEPFWEKFLGQIEDIFIQPKYSSQSREEILKQYFGDAFLATNLTEVFVPSYDIEQRIPIFFSNKVEKQQTGSRNFRKLCLGFTLLDAALATSATPTYFPPHRIPTTHNTNGFYTLVDGGLVANNPAHLAILEAQINKRENKQVFNLEEILVVSLGTGSLTSVYAYNEVKNWGLLQWGIPLLNMVFDGGSEVVAGELERLFASSDQTIKNSYYRFQTFLPSDLEVIDNTKPENIRQLKALAHELIRKRSQEIDELCSLLTSSI
ncbi:MAG: patatin-like phospholipase family protein [Pelatocladus maniniholoensis HA4357-MV3]|uniref:Patatin-like phospholipase family protein n=1 Tax=Pelatocladus maniniholoensis HA4357-MV3 TaxID=1117104 RepID=A0A9E3H5R6_9NOST|nr:patatin-like phospholipase family protein [Pelatocladus maniniholoensis HA4357-MV3]